MRKRKEIIYNLSALFILLVIFSLSTKANTKLALINDPDGYTNIRSGQGKDCSIVAKIEKDDFFYCELTNDKWIKVHTVKFEGSRQIEGYVYRNRVQIVEKLNLKSKKILITKILKKQKQLACDFHNNCCDRKCITSYETSRRDKETFSDDKYDPILEIIPQYFSKVKDISLLQLFLETMWADACSANENISNSIGDCFICQPTFVLNNLRTINNLEERKFYYDSIEFGLLNHYYNVDNDGKSNNKEYNKLKKLLDREKT